MKIQANEIKIVELDKLVPHPKNPHKHSEEQIDNLCKLIKYQGFRIPIIIDVETNYIVAGHGRRLALMKMGEKNAPVIYQKFDNYDQLYAFMVSDNAIGKDTWAELDLSAINTDIADLGPGFDIDLLGIKGFEIEIADKYADKDPDEVPDIKKDPGTVLGDIWQLGNHRLMCGDSTNIEHVERLMSYYQCDCGEIHE